MKGHIRARGERSWELKFDAGRDPLTQERIIRYHSFKGTKREAQNKLAELINAVDKRSYVAPSKATVADYVRARVEHWQAASEISVRTADRYRELVEHQIVPYLGGKRLQDLRPRDIEEWHLKLRTAEAAPRTIGHAHRVLSKALKNAVENEEILKNVASQKAAPKVPDKEMVIVRDVPGFMEKIRAGTTYVPAMIALFTGMRLGEIMALRWSRVNLDGKTIAVEESLEESSAHGLRFKSPKSKAGRRSLTLPEILVVALRDYRRQQQELRLKLGAGRLPDDALLFSTVDGEPIRPNTVSGAWGRCADAIGLPEVTFHALRHTHASQLIDEGVDIVTISKRLGHAKPDITLHVYAHLFRQDDGKAAAAINAAFARNAEA
jgi:integrase